MQVTDVRVRKIEKEGKMKAIGSITLDNEFVIHDIKRKKAAVYDGKNIFVAPLEKAEILLSASETEWQTLWREYYQSVTIAARTSAEREKQMRGNMPVRYWKFLTELQSPPQNPAKKS